MDDLPELPFEHVLSYLSLEDRLKARAVSRRWCQMVDSFKVKSLCCSTGSSDSIFGNRRLVSGSFAQNFICTPRFDLFINTFGPTILSNLKHLRLCDLRPKDQTTFTRTIQSFSRLEELHIIRLNLSSGGMELKLPNLSIIHLEFVRKIDKLILDVPRLRKLKLHQCSLRQHVGLELLHADSLEWLAASDVAQLSAENLKALKYLYCGPFLIGSTFLSRLEQLKEVHLQSRFMISELFEQKQKYGRADLKIFLMGVLLNGPEDPDIDSLSDSRHVFVHLAKNLSRLTAEIPLWRMLCYPALDGVATGSEIEVLSKFTDLDKLLVSDAIPVPDIERFLNLVKNGHIEEIIFDGDQPQELFDRLPEHGAVQRLTIEKMPSDSEFLLRLKHLIYIQFLHQIDAELVRKVVEELPLLTHFGFKHLNKPVMIALSSSTPAIVSFGEEKKFRTDLNGAIEFIFGQTNGDDAEELPE